MEGGGQRMDTEVGVFRGAIIQGRRNVVAGSLLGVRLRRARST